MSAAPSEPAPSAGPATPAPAVPSLDVPQGPVQVASPPLHITYPAVEMDQDVLALSPTEQELTLGSIVPPHTVEAYWLAPYGSPGAGSTNTTYIVGHSWEGRGSPFNNISARSQPGDQFTVTTEQGTLGFKVDAITTENKSTLEASPIWDIVPGRLILITCFTEDLWGKNIIIEASPLETQSR
ncbi:class F sortase [Arthrobacter sp. CDRTa11]|uniref:class F sortase n=1 Tax=Arthrobacter sp. CDRTa11 TaxID=2651199 RepID=UPI002265C005|nr:class F sortase [Arthrobacter sp. CDRTa11]